MAIIQANAKVYVNADNPIKTLEGGASGIDEQDIPNQFGNTQNYYGQTSGAAEQPTDKLWQPSSYVGITTGKTKVLNSTLYYQVAIKVTFRTSHGWGAGTYDDGIDRLCWVSSADITDSQDSALEKYNKRTDGATKDQVQKANNSGKSDIVTIGTGANNPDVKNSSSNKNTITYVLIAFGIAVLSYFIFKRK